LNHYPFHFISFHFFFLPFVQYAEESFQTYKEVAWFWSKSFDGHALIDVFISLYLVLYLTKKDVMGIERINNYRFGKPYNWKKNKIAQHCYQLWDLVVSSVKLSENYVEACGKEVQQELIEQELLEV